MDRNAYGRINDISRLVALRKESVDRNSGGLPVFLLRHVALRKESVDRNGKVVVPAPAVMMSLSARRAWIEMAHPQLPIFGSCVALRKESVDRNQRRVPDRRFFAGRSPQGERG